jgi:2-keto-4-pentenoate hydratase/2-oxohepta-3-ene-1,7-dioic acid hydratase in catechol pathway
MKVANLAGRLVIITGDGGTAIDVEVASAGEFGPDPQAIYHHWDQFAHWVTRADLTESGQSYDPFDLRAPAPTPRQIFAVGFNYRSHANEFGTPIGDGLPPLFTKFPSSVTGPYGSITLPPGSVDWEVELVAIIGAPARQIDEAQAWRHVAGLTVGQDISERETQMRGSQPQFSLGKSYPGFAPSGPWLVTPDEFNDPNDLHISCSLNGVTVQDASTSRMITPVAALIAGLSHIVTLLPGDLIYTGTPGGVGMARSPAQFLRPGDKLVSHIEGIGDMHHTLVAAEPTPEPNHQ